MSMYSRRISWPGSNDCCGFFGLFGRILKVVLPMLCVSKYQCMNGTFAFILVNVKQDVPSENGLSSRSQVSTYKWSTKEHVWSAFSPVTALVMVRISK